MFNYGQIKYICVLLRNFEYFFEKTIIAVQSQCLEYHFKGSSPCSIKILNAAFVSFLFVGRFSELFDFRRN